MQHAIYQLEVQLYPHSAAPVCTSVEHPIVKQNAIEESCLNLCLLHLAKDGAGELLGGRVAAHIASADIAINC